MLTVNNNTFVNIGFLKKPMLTVNSNTFVNIDFFVKTDVN